MSAFQTLPNPPWKAIRNMVFWKALQREEVGWLAFLRGEKWFFFLPGDTAGLLHVVDGSLGDLANASPELGAALGLSRQALDKLIILGSLFKELGILILQWSLGDGVLSDIGGDSGIVDGQSRV